VRNNQTITISTHEKGTNSAGVFVPLMNSVAIKHPASGTMAFFIPPKMEIKADAASAATGIINREKMITKIFSIMVTSFQFTNSGLHNYYTINDAKIQILLDFILWLF